MKRFLLILLFLFGNIMNVSGFILLFTLFSEYYNKSSHSSMNAYGILFVAFVNMILGLLTMVVSLYKICITYNTDEYNHNNNDANG